MFGLYLKRGLVFGDEEHVIGGEGAESQRDQQTQVEGGVEASVDFARGPFRPAKVGIADQREVAAADRRPEAEVEEVAPVEMADAVVDPGTVVV